MENLKCCPFCGGELDLCVNDSGARYVSHPKAECILSRKIFRGHNAVALLNARPATPNEAELVEIGAMALKPYEPIYYKAWAMEVVKALRPFLNADKRMKVKPYEHVYFETDYDIIGARPDDLSPITDYCLDQKPIGTVVELGTLIEGPKIYVAVIPDGEGGDKVGTFPTHEAAIKAALGAIK